jgi:hypothetical protein
MAEPEHASSDAYSSYEAGLRRLLEKLGPDHPRYSEALTYQQRLQENISQTREYGENETRRANRAEIIDCLNELTGAALDLPFKELCGQISPSPLEIERNNRKRGCKTEIRVTLLMILPILVLIFAGVLVAGIIPLNIPPFVSAVTLTSTPTVLVVTYVSPSLTTATFSKPSPTTTRTPGQVRTFTSTSIPVSPAVTPTDASTFTPTLTSTPTASPTPVLLPTLTDTPSPTSTNTPTPTLTPTDTPTPTNTPTPTDTPTPLSEYHIIQVKHSGKCLNVLGSELQDGANVAQWDCEQGGDNQQWRLDEVDGYYEIRVKHSGKCLNVLGSEPQDGANVAQWDCEWGGDNQLWRLSEVEDGYYEIRVKHSAKCLNVLGSEPQDGANVAQWDCEWGGDNQLWRFEPPLAQ